MIEYTLVWKWPSTDNHVVITCDWLILWEFHTISAIFQPHNSGIHVLRRQKSNEQEWYICNSYVTFHFHESEKWPLNLKINYYNVHVHYTYNTHVLSVSVTHTPFKHVLNLLDQYGGLLKLMRTKSKLQTLYLQ